MTDWTPSSEEVLLLHELVAQKRPDLLPLVKTLPSVSLSDEQRASLDDLLSKELTVSGFREDWSINQRGEMLENLIFWIVEVIDQFWWRRNNKDSPSLPYGQPMKLG